MEYFLIIKNQGRGRENGANTFLWEYQFFGWGHIFPVFLVVIEMYFWRCGCFTCCAIEVTNIIINYFQIPGKAGFAERERGDRGHVPVPVSRRSQHARLHGEFLKQSQQAYWSFPSVHCTELILCRVRQNQHSIEKLIRIMKWKRTGFSACHDLPLPSSSRKREIWPILCHICFEKFSPDMSRNFTLCLNFCSHFLSF
jgi:hypothetical protein